MVLIWAGLGYIAGVATVLSLLWVRRRLVGRGMPLLAWVRRAAGLPRRLRYRISVGKKPTSGFMPTDGVYAPFVTRVGTRPPGQAQAPGPDGTTEHLAPAGRQPDDATEHLPAAGRQVPASPDSTAYLPTESTDTQVGAQEAGDEPTLLLPAAPVTPVTPVGADTPAGLPAIDLDLGKPVHAPLPPAPREPTVAPSLAWLRGSGDFLLSRVTTVIGRSSTCDIVLDGDLVSRKHCVISNDGQDWWLEPLETQNGTHLNDRPLPPYQPARLHNGDRIGLGGAMEFTLVVPQSEQGGRRLIFQAFGHSVIGGRRANEDAYHFGPEMIAVADGVGGRPAGALAARLAITGAKNAGPKQDLTRTAREINNAIRVRGEKDVMATGLATTLDVAVLRKRLRGYRVEGLHIGDGTVLLQADTEPVSLVRAHSSEHSAALALPGKDRRGTGRLLRAVGLAETIEPDCWERTAERGQRYVLASDGLLNALGPAVLHNALVQLRPSHPRECVQRLLDLACQADAADNVTLVVADVILAGEE